MNAELFLDGLLGDERRKTGWMRAEAAGDPGPWRQQALLGRDRWEADALRDMVRDHVIEHLGDEDAVLVIDETCFLKQGKASCGVARQTVQTYKDLARVERAFRCMKTADLEIRPIYHWTAPRVRAHVFLCMLAYHVEWHLRDALATLLFHDTELATARAERSSPVASTEPSDAVKAKKATKRSADGNRVVGFKGLMAHLGTLTQNTVRASLHGKHRFTLYAKPTQLQEAAFKLLGLDPIRVH